MVLYNHPRVCDALVQPAHTHVGGLLSHQFHPATEFPVTAYDTATATPFHQGSHAKAVVTRPAQPVCPHKHGPQVQVARAAHHAPGVAQDAFVALLPLRAIFAVPERVRVPRTYIAYHAGSKVNVVFTVRLL